MLYLFTDSGFDQPIAEDVLSDISHDSDVTSRRIGINKRIRNFVVKRARAVRSLFTFCVVHNEEIDVDI